MATPTGKTSTKSVLVTGAGGFIGHHLVAYLSASGTAVRGVDRSEPEFGESEADEFRMLDLRNPDACQEAMEGIDRVYHLAAPSGQRSGAWGREAGEPSSGDQIRMDRNLLEAAADAGVERVLYASCGHVYPPPGDVGSTGPAPLAEEQAWPSRREPGRARSKLFGEQLLLHLGQEHALEARIARVHGVYGPEGPFRAGRAPAPNAVCRKVAQAGDGGTVTVWGSPPRAEPRLFVDDCVVGLREIMRSDRPVPLNLTGEKPVSYRRLVELASAAAGKSVDVEQRPAGSEFGPGRSLDTTRVREATGWSPHVSPVEGMARTYGWVAERVRDLPLDRHPGPPHIP